MSQISNILFFCSFYGMLTLLSVKSIKEQQDQFRGEVWENYW